MSGREARPVYRTRPLPTGELRGRFLVAESVIGETRDALVSFALAGIQDRGHEGLVFWAGWESGPLTMFTSVVIPEARHSKDGVSINEAAYGQCTRAAKARGVVVLAQVHSHPGSDARHSDGDDSLILMPFEGMLSIVVPHYGIRWNGIEEARVHEFQSGQWVLCSDRSVNRGITVAPATIDVRP